MKRNLLAFLCAVLPCFSGFASNEGVPAYYADTGRPNANQNGYNTYQNYGYAKYVGTSGKKQVIGSNVRSYQVPRQQVYEQQQIVKQWCCKACIRTKNQCICRIFPPVC